MSFKNERMEEVISKSPPVLYKYRDWSDCYHKKVLLENSLYMPSPKDFEDKYDCHLPMKELTEEELYKILLRKSKKDNPVLTRQEHKKEARHWCCEIVANPSKFSEYEKSFYKKFNENCGVLSLTADCQNDEMWKKYAKDHAGFCTGFDTRLIFGCIGGGGEVEYFDELPTISPIHSSCWSFMCDVRKNIFSKEEKWEFEKEYRCLKSWKTAPKYEKRNIELPEECIVEILLGKSMSRQDKEEIKRVAKDKYANAKVIECK